jgi:hypothetical protein
MLQETVKVAAPQTVIQWLTGLTINQLCLQKQDQPPIISKKEQKRKRKHTHTQQQQCSSHAYNAQEQRVAAQSCWTNCILYVHHNATQ